MARPAPSSPLEAALAAISGALGALGVRGMIIGGIAASLLGRARTTLAVDVLIWLDERAWPAFVRGLHAHAVEPRIEGALEFARRSRVLLLRHAPTGVPIDISLGALPFEKEAIDRAVATKVGRFEIPLVTAEDLVILKAVAHRPRDLADIEGILAMHPSLDIVRVRRWVDEFASVLDLPELSADFEATLRRTTFVGRATERKKRTAAKKKKATATPKKRRR